MISVIVPAHNEEEVIARCIAALTAELPPRELEIIVVCNGCLDKSAQVARSCPGNVKVIETEVASKCHALNLGDAAANGFPRFYIDADVVLEPGALGKVVAALQQPGIYAAAPLARVDCTDRPWTVKAYYDVWQQLPACTRAMIGSGVYALSKEGRSRFDQFPQVTADDAFVRLHFTQNERVTVTSCTSTVVPPTTLKGIIHIKTRSHFGNTELRQGFPNLWRNEEVRHMGPLFRLALNPTWWPALAVYFYAKLMTRLKVKQRLRRGDLRKWERDDSSRQVSRAAA